MKAATLLWIRRELRTEDLPALEAAIRRGGPVVPVYIEPDVDEWLGWAPGGASRWWLHHSLSALQTAYEQLGAQLVIRRGASVEILRALAHEVGADHVTYTSRVEPWARAQEAQLHACMDASGHPGDLLWDPAAVATKTGGPYKVFTPFWRNCMARPPQLQLSERPVRLPSLPRPVDSLVPADLGLLPTVPWDQGFRSLWRPGAAGGRAELDAWVQSADAGSYLTGREHPADRGTAHLSPHLAFGEVSVARAWAGIEQRIRWDGAASEGASGWQRQLVWREFARHLLWHFPHTTNAPLDARYELFPWRDDPEFLRRWQRGHTGFPMVDAAMRELWSTGWMHNRSRMIVASFLAKDGLASWLEGARWFWDTLLDADLANNTLGWQWAAGCGADAAPFFRIFNPINQGKRYDKDATYLKRWVPELAALDSKDCHEPWKKGALPPGYHEQVVDHGLARTRALEVWREAIRAR